MAKLPPGIYFDGKRHRVYVRGVGLAHGGKTLRDAKRKLAELHRRARGIDPTTLTHAVDEWEVEQRERGRRNVDREARALRRHFLPELGSKRLEEIRPKHVSDLALLAHWAHSGVRITRYQMLRRVAVHPRAPLFRLSATKTAFG